MKDNLSEIGQSFMKFASHVLRGQTHRRLHQSTREQIMARREQYESLIHTSTLDLSTDVSKVNARKKSRLNGHAQEFVVLFVYELPSF